MAVTLWPRVVIVLPALIARLVVVGRLVLVVRPAAWRVLVILVILEILKEEEEEEKKEKENLQKIINN